MITRGLSDRRPGTLAFELAHAPVVVTPAAVVTEQQVVVVHRKIDAKLVVLRAALETGESTRRAARTAGVAMITAVKYRRLWDIKALCGCGLSSTHNGWCSFRFKNSPQRQRTIAAMHVSHCLDHRSSRKHWTELSMMLSALERCVDACGRLDAHRTSNEDDPLLAILEARVRALGNRLDREMDLLTVELLTAQHAAHARMGVQ